MPFGTINDAFLKKLLTTHSISINGKRYHASADTNFAVGDVVLDRRDGCHGVIDSLMGKIAAVRDGNVVEGCPLSQLVKLIG